MTELNKEKKTDMLILKVMIKNLCNLSDEKTQYCFIANYRGVGKEVLTWGEGQMGQNKWNQGKIIEISLY